MDRHATDGRLNCLDAWRRHRGLSATLTFDGLGLNKLDRALEESSQATSIKSVCSERTPDVHRIKIEHEK